MEMRKNDSWGLGTSGFIGKKTIKILKDSGHEVKRFVRRSEE